MLITESKGVVPSPVELGCARRQGIIPSVHGAEEGTDIAAPLEKIDPEPSVALGFPCGGHDDSRGALREIRGAERGHEHVQLSVPLDAPEALRGAQQTEPDPPPPHVAIAPALDV